MAGVDGAPDYVIRSNLFGAFHCLELARRDDAQFVFLSTSRVYPVAGLEGLRLREAETRFELESDQSRPGASDAGIAEDFPLDGARTLYGATKLVGGAPDHGVHRHIRVISHGRPLRRDRRPVADGQGRPGRVHATGCSPTTSGDRSHTSDTAARASRCATCCTWTTCVDLIEEQLRHPDHWAGTTFNVGGGRAGSLSLLETTELCRELTGRRGAGRASAEGRAGDVPVYLSDCSRLFAHTDWRPSRRPEAVLADLLSWVTEHSQQLRAVLHDPTPAEARAMAAQ